MSRATGRGDTVYGLALVALSVVLLLVGAVLLLVGKHDVNRARRLLARDVASVSAREHRSPRDPAVVRAVSAALPHDIRLVPMRDFTDTGRVMLVWHRMHRDAAKECVVLPRTSGGRITSCRHSGS